MLSCCLLVLSGWLFSALPSTWAIELACMDCHEDPELVMEQGGEEISLTVDESILAKSVHKIFDCADCHEGFDGMSTPHKEGSLRVDCMACHDVHADNHAFHKDFLAEPFKMTFTTDCVECHGGHDTVAIDSPDFAFRREMQTQTCGECHMVESEHFAESAHGMGVRTGMAEAPDCLDCHQDPAILKNGDTLKARVAQLEQCQSCHLDVATISERTRLGASFIESYGHSVHGQELAAGNPEAANCVDCHGSHEMNRLMVESSRVNKFHQAETCATCHEEAAAAYNAGIHAQALNQGILDSPGCSDCHGEHNILFHDDPESPVSPRNLSQMLCGECHGSVRLSQKYGISSDRFQTFSDSFHGLAIRGGAVEAVNCASCHGYHTILPSSDPNSMVHKANLAETCGNCHPGANERFAVGRVHVSVENEAEDPILYWIATIYTWAIVLIVGGMLFHNLADFIKKTRRKLAIQRGEIQERMLPHRLYLRMSLNERLQHGALVISFVVLVVTGFMLRYPEAWWVEMIRGLSSGAFEMRSLIHRIAGVVMLLAGFWHAAYLAGTRRGRQLFVDLLPRPRDFSQAMGVLRYNLGLRKEKPKLGRFSYIEKAEYWALMWGSLIMTVTGFFLWFENESMGLFTKLGYDISRTIHFYEAILATLAIIVWHFYFVIFNPDVYPMNLSWLTGRMSEKEMHEEHPAELEAIHARERKPEKAEVGSREAAD